MKKINLALMLLVTLFSAGVVMASGQAIVEFNKPKDKSRSEIKAELEASEDIAEVINFLNELFILKQDVVFSFGGEDGPLFDPETFVIHMPYAFSEEIENRFKKVDRASAKEATNGAVIHTLFHEFAHAIIFMYELPILGREEDAADALGTLLLVDYFENGQEMAISAAELFRLESEDYEYFEDEDFMGEHSLDLQRYYSVLCHVYGSDPDKYESLIDNEYFEEERADGCIEEFDAVSRSWYFVLQPYMKG